MAILRNIFISIIFVFFPFSIYASDCTVAGGSDCTKSGTTYTCTSAIYECVQAAVTAANPLDTINITDTTSRTWASTLAITKGINLIGPGKASLTITGGATPIIQYKPNAATGASDYAFRVSGFTFNTNGYGGIGLCGSTKFGSNCASSNSMGAAVAQTKIRIDNNAFVGSSSEVAVEVVGAFRGVADNNTFTNYVTPQRAWGTGTGQTDWANFGPYVYGSSDSMYFEDNIYAEIGGYMISDCDNGGRYVYRYNTISADGNNQPLWNYHGGKSDASVYGCFGGELYGNSIDTNSNTVYFSNSGSGRTLGFYNVMDAGAGAGNWRVGDAYSDNGTCPADRPDELINNQYYWNSRRSVTGTIIAVTAGTNNCDDVVENTTFWQDAASFDGTVGVGCGTLAARPATCTTGVGYWATNQSCSDLTGLVGDSTQRTSGVNTYLQGTLYKCTDTNTWTAFYTPYQYPHPLRGSDTVAPTATGYAINTAGSSFTVTFDERVTHGAGGRTGWVLTSDGGAVTATYSSGEGSTTLTYQLSRTVYSTETVTGTYTQPTAGIVDTSANEFATVTDVAITNNSTATSGAPTYPKMTLSTGSNMTLSPSGTGSITLAP